MAEKIEFHSRAGKKLLKICMGDIYPNPMVVFREYVQNSSDSLEKAQELGLIKRKEEKIVSIVITSNVITIHDRGIGVKAGDIITCLIDLSFSQKNGESIGRYGIGRLTGAKYCDELVFETSAEGENKKSIVHFNAKMAREIIDSDEELECTDVVDRVTEYTIEDEKSENHYFRVTMNNVFERHLLETEDAKKYLAETVPVDFSSEFKDYAITPALANNEEYNALYEQTRFCNVVFNGESIKKPYKSVVTNSSNQEERIGKIRFFKITNEDESLAWGWYAMTVTAKQYINTVPFRKIRLRQINMAVGDQTYFDNLYRKDVDSLYFIGEVYAVHKKIEPTTGREGLVDNKYKKIFESNIKEKFQAIAKEYNELSKFGSQVLEPLTKSLRQSKILNKQVETNIKTADEIKDEKAKVTHELKEAKDKLANDLTKIRKANRITELIGGIVDYYQSLSDSEIDNYNEKKEVQKSNSIIKKFTISNEIEKIMGEKEPANPTVPTSTENGDKQNGESGESCPTEKPITPVTPPSEFDAYKGLTQLEKVMIRKVYRILDTQKDLAPNIKVKLKDKMVKQLAKK